MLNCVAETKSATPAQISLAWMMAKGIIPIPGTRKFSRLMENVGTVDVILTAEDVSDIDKLLDTMEMSDVFGGHKTAN